MALRLLLLAICLAARSGGGVWGLVTTTTMLATGPNSVFLAEDFGMTQRGGMLVNVQVTPVPNPNAKQQQQQQSPSSYSQKSMGGYFLVLLLKDAQKQSWYGNIPSSDPNQVSQLCTQPAVYRQHLPLDSQGRGNFSYTIPSGIRDADSQYSLALLQCFSLPPPASGGGGGSPVAALSVKATTEMWNAQPPVGAGGGGSSGKSYLAIGDVLQIRVLEGELIVISLFVTILVAQIALSMKPWYILKLHLLFLLTISWGLVLTAVTYVQQVNLNATGIDSLSLDMAVNVVDHFNTTSELVCFLLLSMGWCTTRINMSGKEIRFISGAIALYFILGMASAVCMDNTSSTCQSLALVTYIVKNLLLLGIIIAMNFTVTQLRAGLIHSPWIPSTPVQYARVKQFQMFRLVFILYLLLPTAFLLVQSSFLTWREGWLVFLLNETLTLYMYMHVGATFSPLQEPFLIRAFDNTFTQALRS